MTRWICGGTVTDRLICSELKEKERLGLGIVVTLVQQNWLSCPFIMTVCCAKMADKIEMPFGVVGWLPQGMVC